MRQIFMSYVQADEAFASALTLQLNESGANVWMDIHHAEPGRNWTASIEQALSESHMMIVVLSPEALASQHVLVEWQAYLEAHRPVVPVMAVYCDPPGPLRTRTPVDFTRERDFNKAFHRLTMRLIEYDTRARRRDPVIWTLSREAHLLQEEQDDSAAHSTAEGEDEQAPTKRNTLRAIRQLLSSVSLRIVSGS